MGGFYVAGAILCVALGWLRYYAPKGSWFRAARAVVLASLTACLFGALWGWLAFTLAYFTTLTAFVEAS